MPNLYGNFFSLFAADALQMGDNDGTRRFGRVRRPAVIGNPVQELQSDLAMIGYSVGAANGAFGRRTHGAVMMFQLHFFAGGRGHKNPDGEVDMATAILIKDVAAAV